MDPHVMALLELHQYIIKSTKLPLVRVSGNNNCHRQHESCKRLTTGSANSTWLPEHYQIQPRKHHLHLDKLNRRWSRFITLSSIFVFILLSFSILVAPIQSSDIIPMNQRSNNKNSGHFYVSQLCAGKSQIPISKRVEGAVLSSVADSDINCTVTFRTKSAQQHFVIRFEELKLGCDDHLKMFDSDLDYGQQSIKDFSCRDSLASAPLIKTTGSFLTLHYSTDSKAKLGDGFRLVATAVLDVPRWDCPPDYTLCRNHLCISGSLFCDDVNHCIDNSDEASCSSRNGIGGNTNGSIFSGDLTLSNALGLLVVLVLVIFTCVIIFISAVYCRRESHYAQYQHHLQRAIGVPLQSSSSLMFANHQPQYHYFQPTNLSPYITPQHHAAIAGTLPRGYSTLPLNLVRQQTTTGPGQVNQTQPIVTKANNIVANNTEYLMMAGLAGPPTAAMQAAPTMQTNLYLPTSQSILATGIRYPSPQERR